MDPIVIFVATIVNSLASDYTINKQLFFFLTRRTFMHNLYYPVIRKVLDMKGKEEREMKITFQKWIPNIVQRENNF